MSVLLIVLFFLLSTGLILFNLIPLFNEINLGMLLLMGPESDGFILKIDSKGESSKTTTSGNISTPASNND